MATPTVSITSIITEFGAYYREQGQGVKNLHKGIYATTNSDKLFNLIPTDDTRLDGANVDIGGVLQAYQDTWTPYGDATFVGKHIDLYPVKIDWEQNPTKIWRSWLGFLASNNTDRKTWPFVRYIMEQLILPRAAQDWELNGIFKGTAGTTTAGTVNPILTGVLGLRKQINDGITAADIAPIVLGTVPTDPATFCTYVEAFASGIPQKYWPFLQPIAMSKTLELRYKKGVRAKYNMNYDQADQASVTDTVLKVEGFDSMEGSTKLWTTVRGNAELGVKAPGNATVFQIENVDRMVKIYTDFHKGVGYYRGDMMFTNDVDLS